MKKKRLKINTKKDQKQKQKEPKQKKVHFFNKLNFFRNLTIGGKYGVSLISVFILFLISTTIVSYFVIGLGNQMKEQEKSQDTAFKISEIQSSIYSQTISLSNYLEKQSKSDMEEFEKKTTHINTLLDELDESMTKSNYKELFTIVVENNKVLFDVYTEAKGQSSTAFMNGLHAVRVNNIRDHSIGSLEYLVEYLKEDSSEAVTKSLESQKQTLSILVMATITALVIGGLLVLLISRIVSRNLNKVVNVCDQIASGDLTIAAIDYEGKDEIAKLATSMNKMITNFQTMIKQIAKVSEIVTNHSGELSKSANDVKLGSEQVVATMQELASGSERQASNSSELAKIIEAFASKLQEANQNGETVKQSSNLVISMTAEGNQLMEESTKQMEQIDQIVKDVVVKVQNLDVQSRQISDLVHVIKDIADQTNLLALNAAIEAARAGEHGRGFAVVADEVRKLSEQVALSVKDITNIVGNIQKENDNVTNALQIGYEEVEQGLVKISSTNNTFHSISDSVNDMVNNIQTISSALSEMAKESDEMNQSIQEIASIAEESAAGIEQTSAATEETSASMEEITVSTEQLSKLAGELNELIRQFKL
nr:methyl-accepting chemotaxis protein [Bacillus kwashiorkori]